HRHRPDESRSSREWDGPGLRGGRVSFPSRHATAAFAVMTVVASEYSDHKWVPPVAYGLAVLCAWSRVNDNQHWASDVFAGSAVGYFTAKAILRLHRVETCAFGVSTSAAGSPLIGVAAA
ncbi:MAG: phosphatase PAP2 family protein, partial [Armatimonadota bacterium]